MAQQEIATWEENYYKEVYAETLTNLEARRAAEPEFSFSKLQSLMDTLYARQGDNWIGRGMIHAI